VVPTYISQLTDSISLIYGDGTSYCGLKMIEIWDTDSNSLIDLSTFTLLKYNSQEDYLIIQSVIESEVGIHHFKIKVKLLDYPELGYYPQETSFAVMV
jgi:hypothetical protein